MRLEFRHAMWVALSLAAGCSDDTSLSGTDAAPAGTVVVDIKNGSAWDPWTESTEPWTQNVVRIGSPAGGCTGTLLDYEWVMTAEHCFGATPPLPSQVHVTHVLADGTTEDAHGTELEIHATTPRPVDVALIRLDTPLHPGVGQLPLYAGTTQSLAGQSVFCAGYGAIASGGSCTSTAQCATGFYCDTDWGQCMESDGTGPLRTGRFTLETDNTPPDDNSDIWTEFVVPNAAGQIPLPGDSGSTCWADASSGAVSILKGGNSSNFSHATAVPAVRDWIESYVTPQVVAEVNRPGARCRAASGTVQASSSGAFVAGTAGGTVVCPIDRPVAPTATNLASVPAVWVVDDSSTADVCCNIQALDSTGGVTPAGSVCSSGASGVPQTLTLPSLLDTHTFDSWSVSCTLPPQSVLETYRTLTRKR